MSFALHGASFTVKRQGDTLLDDHNSRRCLALDNDQGLLRGDRALSRGSHTVRTYDESAVANFAVGVTMNITVVDGRH